ncbi:NUDIX hydrolase [Mobilitalea sibirica]|uniref:NUDIX hydrolase n=1 Tax=Mobilitalea sibirica TaxID=1462919 RepID=A0A8J7HDD9_9FIRM|nr:NUDIX hydrolase [Mobilitalea sibirica]MBH1940654.1 NUDIX hydrolase [Mobilitalea sibirica]
MQGYNCILVFSPDDKKLLFCKRTKDPYKGLYNLVGGKIEKDEDGYEAAYRELREETGIDSKKIELHHMMDFIYYNQNCYVEVYAGRLSEETSLYEEDHPLEWLSVEENYFDCNRFAGEGNIGHMVEQVRMYGVGQKQSDVNTM